MRPRQPCVPSLPSLARLCRRIKAVADRGGERQLLGRNVRIGWASKAAGGGGGGGNARERDTDDSRGEGAALELNASGSRGAERSSERERAAWRFGEQQRQLPQAGAAGPSRNGTGRAEAPAWMDDPSLEGSTHTPDERRSGERQAGGRTHADSHPRGYEWEQAERGMAMARGEGAPSTAKAAMRARSPGYEELLPPVGLEPPPPPGLGGFSVDRAEYAAQVRAHARAQLAGHHAAQQPAQPAAAPPWRSGSLEQPPLPPRVGEPYGAYHRGERSPYDVPPQPAQRPPPPHGAHEAHQHGGPSAAGARYKDGGVRRHVPSAVPPWREPPHEYERGRERERGRDSRDARDARDGDRDAHEGGKEERKRRRRERSREHESRHERHHERHHERDSGGERRAERRAKRRAEDEDVARERELRHTLEAARVAEAAEREQLASLLDEVAGVRSKLEERRRLLSSVCAMAARAADLRRRRNAAEDALDRVVFAAQQMPAYDNAALAAPAHVAAHAGALPHVNGINGDAASQGGTPSGAEGATVSGSGEADKPQRFEPFAIL